MGFVSLFHFICIPIYEGKTTTTLKLDGATDSERLGHLSGVTQQAELEPRSSEPLSQAPSIISKGCTLLPSATARGQVTHSVRCGTLPLLRYLTPLPSISKLALPESNR